MFDRRFILGLASAGAIAIIGLANTHGAIRARAAGTIVPNTSCNSTTPCVSDTNKGTGAGLQGKSLKGSGLIGITTFNSTSSSNGQAAIYGNDASTSGSFDIGVHGNSASGTGVYGSSFGGAGVSGSSTDAVGVAGSSNQAAGVQGSAAFNDGVDGITNNQSNSSLTPRNGVLGQDASTDGGHLNSGLFGSSSTGFGLRAASTSYIGADISGGYTDYGAQYYYPALSVVGNGNTDLIDACAQGTDPCHTTFSGSAAPAVFELTDSGSEFIAGFIYTGGSCSVGCARTRFGEKHVRFYTPQESLPTVEDFGEGEMTAGEAHVAIDPAFANTIDKAANYMVFITPEGENNGLYVTGKSASGFTVREVHGGRSTLSFAWRIVARPYHAPTARLQMIAVPAPHRNVR